MGAGPGALLRRQDIARYDDAGLDRVLAALGRMRATLAVDPRERWVRELVEREHRTSVDRLRPLLDDLAAAEQEADERVYALYELPTEMRRMVDAEYDG